MKKRRQVRFLASNQTVRRRSVCKTSAKVTLQLINLIAIGRWDINPRSTLLTSLQMFHRNGVQVAFYFFSLTHDEFDRERKKEKQKILKAHPIYMFMTLVINFHTCIRKIAISKTNMP